MQHSSPESYTKPRLRSFGRVAKAGRLNCKSMRDARSRQLLRNRRHADFLSMEKTFRKEHKSKRSGAQNARKTWTRLELGPRVALFIKGLEVFFVEIVREYLEGLFSKKANIAKRQNIPVSNVWSGGDNLDSSIVLRIEQCANFRTLIALSSSTFKNRLLHGCYTN